MQIVRGLAGYSFGRSDLVRRAMAKKKASVMEAERKNFVHGNASEGVKGCIANGISESVADKIYNDMTDFAKYAFNKSHAAAYAVVSYQTAYLKKHFPVEFMAALMTSVKDNTTKVIRYTMNCRDMGIEILPPDINKGFSAFSVDEGKIRFGMSAIKGIGVQVIEHIVASREKEGPFTSLQDFLERMCHGEINKHGVENLIRAGAFDSLPGNRNQKLLIYPTIIDNVNRTKKDSMSGQISLFDLGDEELAKAKEVNFPNVEELPKEELLAWEKEVLGIYVTGHPLEDYMNLISRNCTRDSSDFLVDEETSLAKVRDGEQVILGGIIGNKTVKTTKNNTVMAFLSLEDLYGTVEVIVFPKDYQRKKDKIEEDAKVFIKGRAQVEENRDAKIICSDVIPFEQIPCELWVRFADKETYLQAEEEFLSLISPYDGVDEICVYLEKEKLVKKLGPRYFVDGRKILKEDILNPYGENSAAIKEKSIEK